MSLNEFQVPALRAIRDSTLPPDALPLDLLSATELQVVHHVARGCTNVEIARSLGKSEATVKKQLRSVYAKLGAKNRVRLLARLLGG